MGGTYMRTYFVALKGLKAEGLTSADIKLCAREPINVERKEADGSVSNYVYLEIVAESIETFADQNAYNAWRDRHETEI